MVTAAELGLSEAEFEAAMNIERVFGIQNSGECASCGSNNVKFGNVKTGELLCPSHGKGKPNSKSLDDNTFTNAELTLFESGGGRETSFGGNKSPARNRNSSIRKKSKPRPPSSSSSYSPSLSSSSSSIPVRKKTKKRKSSHVNDPPSSFKGANQQPPGVGHLMVPQLQPTDMFPPLPQARGPVPRYQVMTKGPPPAVAGWSPPPQQQVHYHQVGPHSGSYSVPARLGRRNPFLGRGVRQVGVGAHQSSRDVNPFCKGTCWIPDQSGIYHTPMRHPGQGSSSAQRDPAASQGDYGVSPPNMDFH